MVLRKLLSNRIFYSSPAVTPQRRPAFSSSVTGLQNAAKTNLHRDHSGTPEIGLFRPFLPRRAMKQLPEFLSVPIGEKLRETLNRINITGDRIHLDCVNPLANSIKNEPPPNRFGISVEDARKVLRLTQIEKLKETLETIPESSIPYFKFVQICEEMCGNREQGVEFARMLDESGNVIVLGDIVFLRPQQVVKSMEKIIYESIVSPNDPRREELKEMEQQKTIIDHKARAQVRTELYCGLGFLVAQTFGLMRLTFWELSWDVMEPICFFITSLHFGLAYGFFLRTSAEPSFEAYFQRRFKTKQKKLMEIHNFDLHKYNYLLNAFYPSQNFKLQTAIS
ncbi:calcium uniporter protein 4, mitochondrial-like [Euphorbia lathyris]|uniref:calcium uniporter protein 4, mitochondrial-like n=1 Tax=Euphorbia lathyris TaxID=212925 RepID=UPI0033140E9B